MALDADLHASSRLLSAPLHLSQRACRPQAGMEPSHSAAASSTSPETARERRSPVQLPNSLSKLLANLFCIRTRGRRSRAVSPLP